MLNRLDALKVFCVAAETLQFRETGIRLGMSPQVVTRTIAALEQELGEVLFQRSTRQVRLSTFGEQLLPQARQLIADSDQLFEHRRIPSSDEMIGVVRVTVPEFPLMREVLKDLIEGIAEFPQLTLDWRPTLTALDVVSEQIDVGVRLGHPTDNRWIVRYVGGTQDRIVASPALIERVGIPRDLEDLQKNFPLGVVLNPNSGRPWPWYIRPDLQFQPAKPRFIAADVYSQLDAALCGRTFSAIQEVSCEPFLARGELVEVLPEIERTTWPIYLYRPQRTVTPRRVLTVFRLLRDSLEKRINRKLPTQL